MEQLGFHLTDFDDAWYLNFYRNSGEKIKSFFKIRQEKHVLYMKMFLHLWQYLAEFFLEWEMLQIKVAEKIKILILCSITFFRKSCRLLDNVERYGGVREAAGDNVAASCILGK